MKKLSYFSNYATAFLDGHMKSLTEWKLLPSPPCTGLIHNFLFVKCLLGIETMRWTLVQPSAHGGIWSLMHSV